MNADAYKLEPLKWTTRLRSSSVALFRDVGAALQFPFPVAQLAVLVNAYLPVLENIVALTNTARAFHQMIFIPTLGMNIIMISFNLLIPSSGQDLDNEPTIGRSWPPIDCGATNVFRFI